MRKSVGAEITFATDIATLDEARQKLIPIIEKVSSSCASDGIAWRTVTFKVKYADFEQITRSLSVKVAARTVEEIFAGIEPALGGAVSNAEVDPAAWRNVLRAGSRARDQFPHQQMTLAIQMGGLPCDLN